MMFWSRPGAHSRGSGCCRRGSWCICCSRDACSPNSVIASPSGSALRQARQRLGPRPVRALFDLPCGPAATSARQVRWRGLLDPHAHPAAELIRIYHERWEIETAYLELKSWILAGRVLRARTPDGIDREIHALLILYQLVRTAMADATDSQPGLDPDRASFTTALNTARDQIVHAAGVIAETVIDLVGVIGAQILANLLPERRLRTKTRMIKRSNSKYQARGPNIDRHSYKATTSIDIISPGP